MTRGMLLGGMHVHAAVACIALTGGAETIRRVCVQLWTPVQDSHIALDPGAIGVVAMQPVEEGFKYEITP